MYSLIIVSALGVLRHSNWKGFTKKYFRC